MIVTARVQTGVAIIGRLATQTDGKPLTTSFFSRTTGLSVSYLEVLCAALCRTGLIKSCRGPGGGYLLGRPAEEISVLEIARAVDPVAVNNTNTNVLVGESTEESAPVSKLFDRASSEMHGFLQSKKLSDVVTGYRSISLV
jgi:Rrf2 family iron-sulfur cluster assembly transcriptional regulator